MNDCVKTEEQLINELETLRRKVSELEESDAARTETERLLRESEQRYKALVDNVAVGIFVVNPRMEIVEVNKTFQTYGPDGTPREKPSRKPPRSVRKVLSESRTTWRNCWEACAIFWTRVEGYPAARGRAGAGSEIVGGTWIRRSGSRLWDRGQENRRGIARHCTGRLFCCSRR